MTNKYFQAVAKVVYLSLSEHACKGSEGFEVEGKLHPRLRLVAKPTVALVSAQMDIKDPESCSQTVSMHHSLMRTSFMIEGVYGDFGLCTIPFKMEWPPLEEEGALDQRAKMLANLTIDDFSRLNDAVAECSSLSEAEEKNSDGECG